MGGLGQLQGYSAHKRDNDRQKWPLYDHIKDLFPTFSAGPRTERDPQTQNNSTLGASGPSPPQFSSQEIWGPERRIVQS